MKKDCSGYEDLHALRFFDQTETVATKARARAAAAKRLETTQAAGQTISPLLTSPPTSIHEQAMSHALKCYVGNGENSGIVSYLRGLLSTDPSDALQTTLGAIGLASLASIHDLLKLKRSASEEYSLALRATNRDLQDPVSATSDSTLATVLLLGLYEQILACHESDMVHGWSNHVQGAVRLIELRGEEQLKSVIEMELFTVVRLQLAMSNLFFRAKYHTSPGIASLSQRAMLLHSDRSQAVEAFYAILIPFNDLSIAIKAAHRRDSFHGDTTAALVAEALRLDADLASWADSLEPHWQYTIAQAHSPSTHSKDIPFPYHNTLYHIYLFLAAATLWNHYRQARITLHEMLRPMLSSMSTLPLSGVFDAEQTLSQSRIITTNLIHEICASVPFFFASDEARFVAVARLPWPLFVAAGCVESSPYTKGWIVRVLEVLAKSTGVRQAGIMTGLIRSGGHGMRLIPGKMVENGCVDRWADI
ncbi:hypothetical protein BJX64DRAFT_296757 [Aspergillus heterothallicus]